MGNSNKILINKNLHLFDKRKDKKYDEIELYKENDLFFIKIDLKTNIILNRPNHRNYIKIINDYNTYIEYNNIDLNLIFEKKKIQNIKYKQKEIISYYNQLLTLLKFLYSKKKCFLEKIFFNNIEFNKFGIIIINDLIYFSKSHTMSRNYKDFEKYIKNDWKRCGYILYQMMIFKNKEKHIINIEKIENKLKDLNGFNDNLKQSILKMIKKENINKINLILI